jgi:hypothetical protein
MRRFGLDVCGTIGTEDKTVGGCLRLARAIWMPRSFAADL